MDTTDSCPGPHKHRGPMLIYACCVGMFFLMFKHYFVGSLNTIKIYLILSTIYIFNTDISCLGEVFAKNTSREMKNIPEPKGEGNLVSRLVFFANTPHNMIYLFNYTEYYLEHWLNK